MLVTNAYAKNGDYSCHMVLEPRPLCFKAQAVSKKLKRKKMFWGHGNKA